MIAFLKQHKSILCILLLALFLRLFLLNLFPTGMTYDELLFVLNAKAIALTGHDMAGVWSPWLLTTIPHEFPTSELSFVPIALLLKFLPLTLFTARLPYALLGVGCVLLIYGIVKKTIGKPQALAASAVFTINPWSLYMSRSAFDVTVALFFFLLGLYFLLISKKWLILLSFPALFFAFYSYIGTKLVFVLFVLFSTLYSWVEIHKKRFTKELLAVSILSILLFLFFVSRFAHTGNARTRELFLPTSTQTTQEVNAQRKLSLQSPLVTLFSNKFVVYSKQLMDRYVSTFSTQLLFVHGDGYGPHLAFDYMGLFYYADGILFLFGLYWLFSKKPREGIFFLSIFLIAQIPSALHVDTNPTMMSRSLLFFPFFCIFVGCGIYCILTLQRSKKFVAIMAVILLAVYSVGISYFFYGYFFRYPIYNSEAFFFGSRLLASYIIREQQATNKPIYVVVSQNGDALGIYRSYIFYDGLYTPSNVQQIQQVSRQQHYFFGTLHFITSDKLFPFDKNATMILANDVAKPRDFPAASLVIPQLKDSGALFTIYNGTTCRTLPHTHYIQHLSFHDLDVEHLSNTDFCNAYIIQY